MLFDIIYQIVYFAIFNDRHALFVPLLITLFNRDTLLNHAQQRAIASHEACIKKGEEIEYQHWVYARWCKSTAKFKDDLIHEKIKKLADKLKKEIADIKASAEAEGVQTSEQQLITQNKILEKSNKCFDEKFRLLDKYVNLTRSSDNTLDRYLKEHTAAKKIYKELHTRGMDDARWLKTILESNNTPGPGGPNNGPIGPNNGPAGSDPVGPLAGPTGNSNASCIVETEFTGNNLISLINTYLGSNFSELDFLDLLSVFS